jgi:hypothetical protein
VDVFAIGGMGVDQVEERADQGVRHDFQRQRQIFANLSRRTRMPDDFGTSVRVTESSRQASRRLVPAHKSGREREFRE